MKPFFYGLILIAGFNFQLNAQSQMELNVRACQQFKAIDRDMNTSYQLVLSKYQNDNSFITAFINAQRQWLLFRDAHIASMYPEADKDTYGSVYLMCHCNAMTEITTSRLKQIKHWLGGVDEGDVCGGSLHLQDTLSTLFPRELTWWGTR
jgi:uncharacterized protein YecT (DUF1311 family)